MNIFLLFFVLNWSTKQFQNVCCTKPLHRPTTFCFVTYIWLNKCLEKKLHTVYTQKYSWIHIKNSYYTKSCKPEACTTNHEVIDCECGTFENRHLYTSRCCKYYNQKQFYVFDLENCTICIASFFHQV